MIAVRNQMSAGYDHISDVRSRHGIHRRLHSPSSPRRADAVQSDRDQIRTRTDLDGPGVGEADHRRRRWIGTAQRRARIQLDARALRAVAAVVMIELESCDAEQIATERASTLELLGPFETREERALHEIRRVVHLVRKESADDIDVTLEEAADAVELIAADGVDAAMNRYNTRS